MPFSRRFGLPSLQGHVPLVVALCIDAIGQGTAGPLMLLFLTRVAELPVGTAGTLLSGAALVGLVVPAVVGSVVDRIGARTVVIIAQVLQSVAMIGYLLSREFLPLMIFAVVAAIGLRAFWSAVFGLVAHAGDAGPAEERDRWFALSGMVQGAGFAIGALLAGALLVFEGAAPFLIALALNATGLLVSALLLLRTPNPRPAHDDGPAEKGTVLKDRPYLGLIAVNTLFAVCSVLLGVGLPLYVVEALDAPRWLTGPLLAMNTVIVATCQGVAVGLFRKRRRTRLLMAAGVIWLIWGMVMATLSVAPSALVIVGLFLGVLLFATAELIHAPTSMALASEAAPARSRSGYLSYFQYSFAVAMVITPGAFGLLFDLQPRLPWLAVAGAALVATVGMALLEPRLPRSAVRESANSAA